jgi:uncharacterized GH25 family protein
LNHRSTLLILGLLICSRASLASAHDFWLQPSQYWVEQGTRSSITLQVGHGSSRQRSPIPIQRITRFQALTPGGAAVELRGQLRLGEAVEDGHFTLEQPGVHVLVMQTDDRAQAHLPALRFNDYLKAEGLTPALEQRARLHRMAADGSERYSRCAKAIVQVGPLDPNRQSQVDKPVGLPLEIVLDGNPYAVPPPANLPIRVLYAGRPLQGALVKLTRLEDDASPLEERLTDHQGRTTFTTPGSGTWLLNVIWTKALRPADGADFETVFSSLSFGFRERP